MLAFLIGRGCIRSGGQHLTLHAYLGVRTSVFWMSCGLWLSYIMDSILWVALSVCFCSWFGLYATELLVLHTTLLLSQPDLEPAFRWSYVRERLKSSLGKFYGRYGDLIKHYEVHLSQMLHDILGHDHIQWQPPLKIVTLLPNCALLPFLKLLPNSGRFP